ncbi:PREDICTED: mitochondrial substrate carrier family protein Y [Tarenaya hassleriana]|uniref:mitochondrial substrate carrier family protein Y n=1 Tax=Tarenaya hassleriana TaxID=28532 RepID=UPI00053C89EA|nr:PREDICTED: mitochondrial substrate carrier family protein Y [Tarenaya hassleriana]XP_010529596.1 PREDICTED: mitochondrial substrate carrier family protein Y [Tarenaya hassleriana]XP_010529597.1 PREDICTED: mitochondrial substrate carrier family protein Y [Tarenaya hassleriana]
MAAAKGSVKKGQPSIQYRCNSSESKKKPSKIRGHVCEEYAYACKKNTSKREETKLSQILSKNALISAVDLMWDRSDFVSGNSVGPLKEDVLDDLDRDNVSNFQVSAESEMLHHADLKAKAHSLPTSQPKLKLLKVTEKMSIFDVHSQSYVRSLSRWLMQANEAKSLNGSCKGNGFEIKIKGEMGKLYSWMKEVNSISLRHHLQGAVPEKKTIFEDCVHLSGSTQAACASKNGSCSANDFFTTDAVRNSTPAESKGPLLLNGTLVFTDTRMATSTDGDYLFALYRDNCTDNDGMNKMSSGLGTNHHTEVSFSRNNAQVCCRNMTDSEELLENKRKDPKMEVHPSSTEIPTYAVAEKKHAFAGGLAGISVSLCLHPLDTVKTITQSCLLEKKSPISVGRSVISERGFSGLYRGIASNIASSAPISALYTFTYESVKGALLPLSPKEYCPLIHCVAGGCASVATSFIFTPSERIKQQMQVSSHYRNCWGALVGIIQKGGLLSLYAGWSAVLCRNIPHSIIKFYVYESLKQLMLPSLDPYAQPNTSRTLICGGLAGSAAAFFTTPFDVVKTRLQTQIPGSKNGYHNVFQALRAIGKQEGLRGLYRGLIPRLVMYMSQGAIFFASYEFYKSILSLETPQTSYLPDWLKPRDENSSPLNDEEGTPMLQGMRS